MVVGKHAGVEGKDLAAPFDQIYTAACEDSVAKLATVRDAHGDRSRRLIAPG